MSISFAAQEQVLQGYDKLCQDTGLYIRRDTGNWVLNGVTKPDAACC